MWFDFKRNEKDLSEDFEDDEESEEMQLYIKDGKLTKWEGVELEKESFELLQKGMKKLKEKYPKIAEECFGESSWH